MRATAVYHYKQGSASTTGPSEVDQIRYRLPVLAVTTTLQTKQRQEMKVAWPNGISDPSVEGTNGKSNNGVTLRAPHKRRRANFGSYLPKQA